MEIAPGAALDESSLSETYGISRTPLREVLQRLAGEGYIELSQHKGAKIASMDLAVMRTFFQTAPMIYCAVARLAAENRTAAEVTALKAAQQAFTQAVAAQNPPEMALANHGFHEQIGAMARNAYLTPSLNRLLIDHTRLGQMFYRPAAPADSQAIHTASQQHDEMIAAIEAGEAAKAVALTLAHWDLSRDRMERFVRPDPLPHDLPETGHAV